MKLSIIIPCYNEEKVIEKTAAVLKDTLSEQVQSNTISAYELLFVNDGSRDKTLEILESLASTDDKIKAVSFSNNFGHQAALTAGINEVRGDILVTMDADLQDPPEYIAKMIEKINEGHDIVYGVRQDRTKDTVFKKYSAQIYYKILKLMGVDVVYNHAEYRMFTDKVRQSFIRYDETNRFIRGLFPLMGFKHCTVEYPRDSRAAGETKYSFRKMFVFAIEGVTSFSYVPLRLAAFLGLIVFICAIGLSIWALITKIWGETVPGWASVVIPIYMFGGLQMIFLGIIGEYIGKIYLESKKRPLYIIDKKVNL